MYFEDVISKYNLDGFKKVGFLKFSDQKIVCTSA